ncbi:MIP transporter [Aspergillus bombycis]|uniref:MIP transporter n=1 Tax=Aspergillus bombycis TaxID=109264 RepID=A0A1F7ZWW6_9EURO|nr:MIP transporter [Aspergillus bombycis]OGM43963.1 MIP transporter [Aspergillus bombycis]
MDDSSPRRPRARSEATSQSRPELNRETSPGSPRRGVSDTANYGSPTRRTSGVDTTRDGGESDGMRRRSTVRSARTGSLAQRTTLAERTQGQFTMGGPEDGPQLRQAHEPFVQPGYSDLNPSYEQPANTKPVWSLAKPLPRVVRAGMVPTKEELLDARLQPERPAENSQKLGLDVDPNDLEQGQIPKMADPRKMAAQVEDARLQRENNFVNKVLTGDVGPSRVSRTSSTRRRRPSVRIDAPSDQLSTVPEGPSVVPSATSVPAGGGVLHGSDEHWSLCQSNRRRTLPWWMPCPTFRRYMNPHSRTICIRSCRSWWKTKYTTIIRPGPLFALTIGRRSRNPWRYGFS